MKIIKNYILYKADLDLLEILAHLIIIGIALIILNN